MVNPLDRAKLPALISELKLHGWVRRTGVLEAQNLQSINGFFDRKRDRFELAPVIDRGLVTQNELVRGDRYIATDLKSPATELLPVVELVNNFASELRVAGETILDCQLHPSFFPELHFFRKHLDVYGDSGHVISFVFYVNQSWDPSWGGNLILYDRQNREVANILPEPGSFVAFLSREMPHQVKLCKRERRSIAGWFHDRPLTTGIG